MVFKGLPKCPQSNEANCQRSKFLVGKVVAFSKKNDEIATLLEERKALAESRDLMEKERTALKAEVEHWKKKALVDSRTGLFSQFYFEETIKVLFSQAARHGTELSFIMMDLDGFKGFNDTHGHLAGNLALGAIGSFIKTSVRASDIPCKYGGDEFVVILPNTILTSAYAVAEKLRKSALKSPWCIMLLPRASELQPSAPKPRKRCSTTTASFPQRTRCFTKRKKPAETGCAATSRNSL